MAMLSAPRYLATVASVVRTFNRSGLIVTPYLYATVVGASAVCTIQVRTIQFGCRSAVLCCMVAGGTALVAYQRALHYTCHGHNSH